MPQIGIAAEAWRSTQSMTGFAPTPALSGYFAEVYEVKQGVSDKDGSEYINVMLELAHDDLENDDKMVKHAEFFALTEERLGWLKGFLEKIGRCDLMHENADWDDLISTQFECDISHAKVKSTGKVYANVVQNSIKAVSHDFFEISEVYEEVVQDAVDELGIVDEDPPKPPASRRAASRAPTRAAAKNPSPAPKETTTGKTRKSNAVPRRSPRARVDIR